MKIDIEPFVEFDGRGVMVGVFIGDHDQDCVEPYVSLSDVCKSNIDAHRLVGGKLAETGYDDIAAMREQLVDALEYIDQIINDGAFDRVFDSVFDSVFERDVTNDNAK